MHLITRLLAFIIIIYDLLTHAGVTPPAPQDGCSLMYIHTETGLLVCLTGAEPADRFALTLTLLGRGATTAVLTPAPGVTLTRMAEDGSRLLLEGTRCGGKTLPLLYIRPEGELTLAPPGDAPNIYYRIVEADMTAPTIKSAPLAGVTLSLGS